MGLFDLHGNVWEKCGDSFCPYTKTDALDPYGEGDDRHLILRGGAFNSTWDQLQSAMRHKYLPHIRYDSIGFRMFEKNESPTTEADVPAAGETSKLESTKTLDSDIKLRDSKPLQHEKKLVDPE